MIIPVIQHPATVLRRKSDPVTELTEPLKKLAMDMKDTLDHHKALGISAIQLGAPYRFFLLSRALGVPATLIINPKVMEVTFKTVIEPENCLSINEGRSQFNVKRAKAVKIWGLNSFGEEIAYDIGGMASRVVQRQIDLLDGKLIIDFAELIRA